jgi:hypothetical protein
MVWLQYHKELLKELSRPKRMSRIRGAREGRVSVAVRGEA